MNKQVTLYQGLFLIAFALYANERNQAHPVVIQKEHLPAVASVPLSPELAELYSRLKVTPVFSTPIDGLTLTLIRPFVRIELKSDELYRTGETAMEETWQPVLDQIGNALFQSGEPHAIVVFSSNTDDGKDSFSASSARAEWVLRYLSRKYQLPLDRGRYRIQGLGKALDSQGKTTPTLQIWLQSET